MYIFSDYLSGQKGKKSCMYLFSRDVEPSSCRKFSGAGTCLRIWHCMKLQQDGLIRLLLLVWMDTTTMIFESFLDLLRAFGFPYLWNWCDACSYTWFPFCSNSGRAHDGVGLWVERLDLLSLGIPGAQNLQLRSRRIFVSCSLLRLMLFWNMLSSSTSFRPETSTLRHEHRAGPFSSQCAHP